MMDASNGDRVRVGLLVNDYRSGNHTRQADTIELDDGETLQLSGQPIACYRQGRHYLKFGRMVIRLLGYSTWVGNWCWDSALFKIEDAARIINYCKRAGWTVAEGEIHLYDKYQDGSDITADDIRQALGE